jgi:hypothetical protein
VLVPPKSVYLFLLLEVHLSHIFAKSIKKWFKICFNAMHTVKPQQRKPRFFVGVFTKILFACFSEFTYNSVNVKEKRSS